MREKLVSSLCQRYSVAKRLFGCLFLAKNQIFLNEAKWDEIEYTISREIASIYHKISKEI